MEQLNKIKTSPLAYTNSSDFFMKYFLVGIKGSGLHECLAQIVYYLIKNVDLIYSINRVQPIQFKVKSL